jgi:hypothetical protein
LTDLETLLSEGEDAEVPGLLTEFVNELDLREAYEFGMRN